MSMMGQVPLPHAASWATIGSPSPLFTTVSSSRRQTNPEDSAEGQVPPPPAFLALCASHQRWSCISPPSASIETQVPITTPLSGHCDCDSSVVSTLALKLFWSLHVMGSLRGSAKLGRLNVGSSPGAPAAASSTLS